MAALKQLERLRISEGCDEQVAGGLGSTSVWPHQSRPFTLSASAYFLDNTIFEDHIVMKD